MASTGSQTGISIWDISLSAANLIYGAAYIALIIGSILTAVATISLFYSSAIRDRYADAGISHAKKDAAEALERAVWQNADNLKIKQRTAELEKDAALIKQQTLSAATSANNAHRDIKSVRKQLLPRRITERQIKDLSGRLLSI